MVGSMGHASSIALGIALQKPDRQVIKELSFHTIIIIHGMVFSSFI